MMTAGSEVAKLVDGILVGVKTSGSRKPDSWQHPKRDIRRLAQRDYARCLRRLLNQSDVEDVVRSARGIFPNLNRDHDPARSERWLNGTPSRGLELQFSRVADRLDIHFQGTPFTGPEGLALCGFFVDRDQQSLKRPLINVNTSRHPVAVAATFFHEVGHLVSAEVLDRRPRSLHFLFGADYVSHLNDVEELSADIVLSLEACPAPIAKKIFSTPWNWGILAKTAELSDKVFSQVSEHFSAYFGVSLAAADLPARRKLNYLAGMIHFAKLRATLLAEYGV
jgi:hypothetical protein